MSYASQHPQSRRSSRQFFSWLTVRADIALLAVIALAEMELYFTGISLRIGGLIIASILSMIILFSINRGARNSLVIGLSYLPYLFGLYLFFVEGFGRLVLLLSSFSIEKVALIIFFFVIGSSLSSVGYNATLQVQRLREGH